MNECFNCEEPCTIQLIFYSHSKKDGVVLCYGCVVTELGAVLCVGLIKNVSITLEEQS